MRIDSPRNHYDGIMDDSALTFGQLIARARTTKGWTQDDLQAQSGISRPTISRWERDAMPGTPEPDTVRALCAALGIDPRRAAVSLGYLTVDEIEPSRPLPLKLQQVIDVLEDPTVSADDKERWLDYLMYLRDKARSRTDLS